MNKPINAPLSVPVNVFWGNLGPPSYYLRYITPEIETSISLSPETIALLTTEQQSFFTGQTWANYATFYAAVSAQSWFSEENIIGTEEKGVWIGGKLNDRAKLNRVLRWFGLEPIYPEFGPTWNDAEIWDDIALWTE